ATTASSETVRFTSDTASDPCDALTWRIRWQDVLGNAYVRDVQASADADRDGVADVRDDCPTVFDPGQADADHDGTGDACAVAVADADADGVADGADHCPGTAASALVLQNGCAIAQLCPCTAPSPRHGWIDAGRYVSCVEHAALQLVREGRI